MNNKNIKDIYIFVNNITTEMSSEDRKKNFELGIIVYTDGTSGSYSTNKDLNDAIDATIVSFATPEEKASAYVALKSNGRTKLFDSTLITRVREDADKIGLDNAISKLNEQELKYWQALITPIYKYSPQTREYYHLNDEISKSNISVAPVFANLKGLQGTPTLKPAASKKHKWTKGKIAVAATSVVLAIVLATTGLALDLKRKAKARADASSNSSVSDTIINTNSPELLHAQKLRKDFFSNGESFLSEMKAITDKVDPKLELSANNYIALYLYTNQDYTGADLSALIGNDKLFNVSDLELYRQDAITKILGLNFKKALPNTFFDKLSYSDATKEYGSRVMDAINREKGNELNFNEVTKLMAEDSMISPLIGAEVYGNYMQFKSMRAYENPYKESLLVSDRVCSLRTEKLDDVNTAIESGILEVYGSWNQDKDNLIAKYNAPIISNTNYLMDEVYKESVKEGLMPSQELSSLPKPVITKTPVSNASLDEVKKVANSSQIAAADKAAGINNDKAKDDGYKDANNKVENDPNIEGPVTETPKEETTEKTEEKLPPVIETPTDGNIYDKDGNVISGGVQAPPTNNAETDAVKDAINNAIKDATAEPPKVEIGDIVPVQPQSAFTNESSQNSSTPTVEVGAVVPISVEAMTVERKAALDEVINQVLAEYTTANSSVETTKT
ncbi:MAG: hypothetical protein RR047_01740, partial [Bacilli bacterium]